MQILDKGIQINIRSFWFMRIFGKRTMLLVLHRPTMLAVKRAYGHFEKCHRTFGELSDIAHSGSELFDFQYKDHLYRSLACLLFPRLLFRSILLNPLAMWLQKKIDKSSAIILLETTLISSSGTLEFVDLARYIRYTKIK